MKRKLLRRVMAAVIVAVASLAVGFQIVDGRTKNDVRTDAVFVSARVQ